MEHPLHGCSLDAARITACCDVMNRPTMPLIPLQGLVPGIHRQVIFTGIRLVRTSR